MTTMATSLLYTNMTTIQPACLETDATALWKVVAQRLKVSHAQPVGDQLLTATICNWSPNVKKTQCNHWETTYSIRRRMSSSVYSFEWAITVACSVLLPSPLAESLFGILYYVWVSWNLLWWRLSPKGTSAVGRLTWTSQSKTSLSLSTMYLFQCLSI